MTRRNLRALGIFLLFYVGFGVFLVFSQEKIVYQPAVQDFTACTAFSAAEKVESEGTRMYVNVIPKQPVVVLYHGNAGSACDRYFYAEQFSLAGYGYVVVEYAGYSNDSRIPSHKLLKQDVRNVIAYLEERGTTPVYVVGESIGTGLASYHASLEPPERLLLISPFTDLQAVAAERFWFYPTSLLVDNAFDNTQALSNYDGETMIIHGTSDTIIPYQLGEALFASLAEKKEFVTIGGAGHNNLFTYPAMYQALQLFLNGEE